MPYVSFAAGSRVPAIFLLILLGTGFPCFAQPAGCPVSSNYTRHDAGGIVLEYPSNWQVLSGEDGETRGLALFPEGFTFATSPCSLQVIWMPPPAGATLDATAQWYLAEAQKKTPRLKQNGPTRRGSLNGSPSLTIPFLAPDDNGVDWDEGEFVITLLGREMLILMPQSFAGTWERVGPVMSGIIASVRLNGGAASPAQPAPGSPAQAPNPSTMITSGPKQFRHPEFSFQYPGNWGITPGETETAAVFKADRKGTPFYRLQLQPLDGTENVILVSYHKFSPPQPCIGTAQWLEGMLNVEYSISYFDQDNVPERFPAGAVTTTRASRSLKMPGTEVLRSSVCSNGQVVTVVFAYNTGYPSTARDMILRTLSFSGVKQTLDGSWDGEGPSVLTFQNDGTAGLSLAPPAQVSSKHGTYRVSGERVTITWNASPGLGGQQVWNCGYTFTSGELHLDCGRGTQVYRRSGIN